MRWGSVVAAVALAACTQASGPSEPRTMLPLTAPAGATGVVKDFIEVCSQGLVDANKAVGAAGSRGWKPAADGVAMAAAGSFVLTHGDDSPDRSQLLINDINYPHQHSRTCQLIVLDVDALNGPPDLSAIDKIEGIKGGVVQFPAMGSRGLWSFIGPEGDVVTISTIFSPPRILQLNMGTSHRLPPPKAKP